MKISILIDKNSWIKPYAEQLLRLLERKQHAVKLYFDHKDVPSCECLVILSYEKVIPKEVLLKNKHNLVVHESDLPQGKGWSPLTWQILEGKNSIPITLFEASEKVDNGEIYFQDEMRFNGHELVDELRAEQGKKTIDLLIRFFDAYPDVKGKKQEGKESFYHRRGPKDSELDINKSLMEEFNKLRVADNEKYPAFICNKGHKYILKVYEEIKEKMMEQGGALSGENSKQ